MCWPALAAPAITAGAQLGGGAIAGQQQGVASEAQGEFIFGIQRNNALRARLEAREAQEVGDKEAATLSRQIAALKADQAAAFAANGININTGSAGAIREDTALLGRLDLETKREETFKIRRALDLRASEFERQANLALEQGKQARRLGEKKLRGLFGSGIGGALVGVKGAKKGPGFEPFQGLGSGFGDIRTSFNLFTGR